MILKPFHSLLYQPIWKNALSIVIFSSLFFIILQRINTRHIEQSTNDMNTISLAFQLLQIARIDSPVVLKVEAPKFPILYQRLLHLSRKNTHITSLLESIRVASDPYFNIPNNNMFILKSKQTQLIKSIENFIAAKIAQMQKHAQLASPFKRLLVIALALFFIFLSFVSTLYHTQIARQIMLPLKDFAEKLLRYNPGLKQQSIKLPNPNTLELKTIKIAFEKIMEQFNYYIELNIDNLLLEASKTEAIVECLEDALLVLDHKNRIQYTNQGFAEIVNLTKEDMTMQSWSDLNTGDENYILLRDYFNRYQQGSLQELSLTIAGQKRIFGVRTRDLKSTQDGSKMGRLWLLHDITEKIKIQGQTIIEQV